MKYLWGLLLLMLGVGYLGASLGYLDYNAVNKIWAWWPLILVFIGLDIMTRKLKYGWIVMTAFTLLVGLVIYDISFAPRSYLGLPQGIVNGGVPKTSTVSLERKPQYRGSEVAIDTGAMKLAISQTTDKLIDGTLVSGFSELKSQLVEENNIAKVKLTTVNFRPNRLWLGGDFENRLSVSLSPEIPYKVLINSGASDLNLDLSGYRLSGVEIKAGASSIDLKLGEKVENNATISFDSGASEIAVKVPRGLGVRLKSESTLTSTNFKGFTRVGDSYENVGYNAAATKINIIFKTGASSVMVEEY